MKTGQRNRFGLILAGSIFILVCIQLSCARVGNLSGGEKDTKPPEIVWLKSTPNLQKNFTPNSIQLSFNEWVSLNNAQQNIVIAPALEFQPNIKLKAKTVNIELDPKEVLKQNTTYVIQLGEAIKDITEGNPGKNLEFIFSTGSYIDSLKISGSIKSAENFEPIKDAIVCLYKDLEDTLFISKRPDLYTKIDSKGEFKINYLQPGKYKIYGLLDKNQNRFYDLPTESLAFLDEPVQLNYDSSIHLQLLMSTLRPPTKIIKNLYRDNSTLIQFNQKPTSLKWKDKPNDRFDYVFLGDSVLIWHENKEPVSALLEYEGNVDTIVLKPRNYSSIKDSLKAQLSTGSRLVKPGEPLEIYTVYPILDVNNSLIKTNPLIEFEIKTDSLDKRKFYISLSSFYNQEVDIIIDSLAVSTWPKSVYNRDSFHFRELEKEKFSVLKLIINGLTPMQHYIVQLISNSKIVDNIYLFDSGVSVQLVKKNLNPGKYQIKIIEDLNKNGIWDPANYSKKQQSEPVFLYSLDELRADWEVEQILKIK